MQASGPTPAQPQTPDSGEELRRRQQLEDVQEDLRLAVLALEAEWLLDDRIAYALRRRDAA
jgi:hypothetical protein